MFIQGCGQMQTKRSATFMNPDENKIACLPLCLQKLFILI